MKINKLFVIFSQIKELDYIPIVDSNHQIKQFIYRKKINPLINRLGNYIEIEDILDSLVESNFFMKDFMEILNKKKIDSILTLKKERTFIVEKYNLEQFKINFYLVEKLDNFKEIFNLYTIPSIILNIAKEVIFINKAASSLFKEWQILSENPLAFFSKQFNFEKEILPSKNNFYHDIDYEKCKRVVFTKQLLPLSNQGKVIVLSIVSVVKIDSPKEKKKREKLRTQEKQQKEEKQEFYNFFSI